MASFPRPKLSLVVMMLEVPIWKAGICSLHEGTLSLHHLQLECSIAYLNIFSFFSMTQTRIRLYECSYLPIGVDKGEVGCLSLWLTSFLQCSLGLQSQLEQWKGREAFVLFYCEETNPMLRIRKSYNNLNTIKLVANMNLTSACSCFFCRFPYVKNSCSRNISCLAISLIQE